jgi:hypothetical protein
MAFLAAGTGKPVTADMAEVYYDLLSDLPLNFLQFAAKRALLENEYPVFPPLGVLRKLATSAMQGPDRLPAHEAFGIVLKAIAKYSYMREREALAALPEPIAQAAQVMGWRSMCFSESTEIIRAQFCKTYDAILARRQRENLLPAPMQRFLIEAAPPPPLGLYQGPDLRSAGELLVEHRSEKKGAAS